MARVLCLVAEDARDDGRVVVDAPANGSRTRELLDLSTALEHLSGDRELLLELANIFLAEHEELLANVKRNLGAANGGKLSYAAHVLKGAVANFHHPFATKHAQELENLAANGSLADAEKYYCQLEVSVLEVVAALKLVADG